MKSVGGVLVSLTWALSPQVDKPLKSVMHGQCDARPAVTFPVAGHRGPATGTKLYCLVTEAYVCEQLALTVTAQQNSPPLDSQTNALTITPPGHT